MITDGLFFAVSGLTSAYGVFKGNDIRTNTTADMNTMLDQLVNTKFATEHNEALRNKMSAESKYDSFLDIENNRVKELTNTDEYFSAVAKVNAAKSKIDILKKSIKNFEADKTQVAVGSGESAVAVSISNSSAKAALESDLAAAQAELKVNTDLMNTIKSKAKTQAVSERTNEFYEAKQNFDEASNKFLEVKDRMNKYRSQLSTDDPEVRATAIRRNYTKTNIITVAAMKSAFPAWVLYEIWKGAISDLKALEAAKEVL